MIYTLIVFLRLFALQLIGQEQPVLTYTGNVNFTSQAQLDAWLPCYTIIDGNVTIQYSGINDLKPLMHIVEITGNVNIRYTSQTSMAGLESLTMVGTDLNIYRNSLLTTLDGLENVATVVDDLRVYLNLALTDRRFVFYRMYQNPEFSLLQTPLFPA